MDYTQLSKQKMLRATKGAAVYTPIVLPETETELRKTYKSESQGIALAPTLSAFKSRLKTHFFRLAFL